MFTHLSLTPLSSTHHSPFIPSSPSMHPAPYPPLLQCLFTKSSGTTSGHCNLSSVWRRQLPYRSTMQGITWKGAVSRPQLQHTFLLLFHTFLILTVFRPTPCHRESGKVKSGGHLTIQFVHMNSTLLERQHVYQTERAY